MAAAVTRNGQQVYKGVFGWADAAKRRPLTDDDAFQIMSCTKAVTVVAAMQLHERGLWGLDDPVARFIPEFANVPGVANSAGNLDPLRGAITMRHVLTHTSGLTYEFIPVLQNGMKNPLYKNMGEVVRNSSLYGQAQALASIPLVHQPGTMWDYGMGINVVGAVIEALTAMPYEQYVHANVFLPLGMSSATFAQRASQQELGRLVKMHTVDMESFGTNRREFLSRDYSGNKMTQWTDNLKAQFRAVDPGGGLTCTVDDFVAFADCLAAGGGLPGGQGVLVSRESLQLMSQDHLASMSIPNGPQMTFVNGTMQEDSAYGFGLGVAVPRGSAGGERMEWGGLASTIFWVDFVRQSAVVAFTQLMPPHVYAFRTSLRELIAKADAKDSGALEPAAVNRRPTSKL